jgi:serine/threonine protein kinase/Tol biopolymer transport system component
VTLAAGSRLGPYEILSAIGAGGMGEVYRARDTRLGRDVAVKVLPDHLSSSEELRQRFEREAKTISQLSHPHICALYDVGNQDGLEYLVMELLEGETLTDRILRGPLPLEQALRHGIEIADALDRAHRSGIVHRDLKPGNVMLTKSGVKLLDFGLAKIQAAAANAESGATSLPTMTPESHPLTTRGTILGTFQYMAPEQLEGREADARSDIFAFGCVLYEMATGTKAFAGKSQASLIGAIMHSEPPPVSSLAPMTPPAFDRVVKTCMAKDAEERFQTAHDVRLQLQWIAEGGSAAGLPAPVVARRKSRERLAWAVAGAAIAAAALLGAGYLRRAPVKASAIRFEISTPEGVSLIDSPKISPDGKLLAFNASDSSGKSRIWVRPLSALTAQPLAGTEGAARPFWSPDSRFLGFFAEGKLKKIEVSGGPPQKICDYATGADGSWSPAGVILFDGRAADPIQRVSAEGGTPVVAVKADASRKETMVAWPEFLPDGRHFLYMAQSQKAEDHMYRIGSLDSKESRALAPAQSLVTYAPPGHLLFVRESTLVAQPFDAKAMKTTGEPVPLAEHVGTIATGLARFSASRNGVLAYRTGDSGSRLLWFDRDGKELSAVGDPGDYSDTMLSPGGDRLAFVLSDPRAGKADIWIRDLARGASSRFTFDPAVDISPLWSPDGKTIVFSSDRGGQFDLYTKAAGGGGQEQPLLHSEEMKVACDWSRDGRYIAFQSLGKKTNWDLWVLPTSGDRKPILFLQTPFNETRPAFSPDGKWLAYQSNESGRPEIYVQNFPGPGGKWQVSTAGGVEPAWRADGKELFYGGLDQKLMAVEIQAGETFEAGVPRALFHATVQPIRNVRSHYLASADGQRFLLLAPLGRESMVPTTVVVNWNAGLSR